MLDRHLFKARRTDGNGWVQGSLFERGLSTYIALSVLVNPIDNSEANVIIMEVDKNTICQCTSLKDKNGNLIWEHDVVVDKTIKTKGEVIYWDSEGRFTVDDVFGGKQIYTGAMWKDVEVVGNKFDNPELLRKWWKR